MAAKRKPAEEPSPVPSPSDLAVPDEMTAVSPEPTPAPDESPNQPDAEQTSAAPPDEPAEEPAPEPEPVPDFPSDALVTVRLTGANTVMLDGRAMFKGEARTVKYAALVAALAHHSGKFQVRYPGSNQFVSA